jgi:hypothetical protein
MIYTQGSAVNEAAVEVRIQEIGDCGRRRVVLMRRRAYPRPHFAVKEGYAHGRPRPLRVDDTEAVGRSFPTFSTKKPHRPPNGL